MLSNRTKSLALMLSACMHPKVGVLFRLQWHCEAYDLIFGHVDPGIGVTLCRESAEPRRDDTGDDDSLAIF